MQVAAPLELYNRPANLFVAGFIGSPAMNFFRGTIQRSGDALHFVETNTKSAPAVIALDGRLSAKAAGHAGKPVVFGIRPEDVQDIVAVPQSDPARTIEVTVEVSEPMGSETYLYLTTGASAFVARVGPTDRFDSGQKVKVVLRLENAHLFDAETEQVLT